MKNLILLFATILFIACQKDIPVKPETSVETVSSKKFSNDVFDYLENYYNESFITGDTILTVDGFTTYEVVEIIVGEDIRARGYVVIDGSGEFVFHADVDRVNFVLSLQTIGETSPLVFTAIDQMEEYDGTDEFDFIFAISNVEEGLTPDGEESDPELKTERPFWGKGNNPPLYYDSPCLNGHRTAVYQYYSFWIKNGTTPGIVDC